MLPASIDSHSDFQDLHKDSSRRSAVSFQLFQRDSRRAVCVALPRAHPCGRPSFFNRAKVTLKDGASRLKCFHVSFEGVASRTFWLNWAGVVGDEGSLVNRR